MNGAVAIDRIEMGRRLRGINEAQVAQLADSIADVGLLNPITVYPRPVIRDGVSVDGYGLIAGAHRLRACQKLGLVDIEAHVVQLGELQRQIAECDENLCGSVLTPSERALFTRRRKDAYEALHPETKREATLKQGADIPSRQVGETGKADRFTADTAAKTGQSERTVQRDAARGTISDRALAALRGTHLDKGAYLDELRRLENEEQQLLAIQRDLDAAKAALAAAKEIRAARQRIRHSERLAHMDMVAEKGASSAPDKVERLYPVVYADPPWRFAVRAEETGREKSAENHYPTMPTEEICGLLAELGGVAARDAVLFLWATNPMLLDALAVMQAWGFSYKSHWIWDKEVAGTGYWGRDRHELLLIGTRGDAVAPLPGTQPETVHRERKGRHSAKPDHFADVIERLYPGIGKIELFARAARPGWDRWGFEAPEVQEAVGSRQSAVGEGETAEIAGDAGPGDNESPAEATSSPPKPGEAGTEPPPSAPASAITEDEFAEYKALGAIDAGVTIKGPLVERLNERGLVWAGKELTVGGAERLAELSRKVEVASDGDAVKVQGKKRGFREALGDWSELNRLKARGDDLSADEIARRDALTPIVEADLAPVADASDTPAPKPRAKRKAVAL